MEERNTTLPSRPFVTARRRTACATLLELPMATSCRPWLETIPRGETNPAMCAHFWSRALGSAASEASVRFSPRGAKRPDGGSLAASARRHWSHSHHRKSSKILHAVTLHVRPDAASRDFRCARGSDFICGGLACQIAPTSFLSHQGRDVIQVSALTTISNATFQTIELASSIPLSICQPHLVELILRQISLGISP